MKNNSWFLILFFLSCFFMMLMPGCASESGGDDDSGGSSACDTFCSRIDDCTLDDLTRGQNEMSRVSDAPTGRPGSAKAVPKQLLTREKVFVRGVTIRFGEIASPGPSNPARETGDCNDVSELRSGSALCANHAPTEKSRS